MCVYVNVFKSAEAECDRKVSMFSVDSPAFDHTFPCVMKLKGEVTIRAHEVHAMFFLFCDISGCCCCCISDCETRFCFCYLLFEMIYSSVHKFVLYPRTVHCVSMCVCVFVC